MDDRELSPGLIERPRPTVFAALGLMLIAVIGLWLSSLLVAYVLPEMGTYRDFWMDAVFYLPFVLLPIAVYCSRRPGLGDAMRLGPMPPLSTLVVVLAALMSVYMASAVNGVWSLLLDALGLHEPEVELEIASSRELMLAIVHTAAIPAICEELLCRGFVLSALESRGTRFAIWASALMFALMHGNVYGLPAYLLVGAVSGFFVFALDSVYAGIVYHTVYNAAILAVIYMIPGLQQDASAAPSDGIGLSVIFDALVIGLSMYLLLRSVDLRRRIRGIEVVPRIREPLRKGEKILLIALGIVYVGTAVLVLLGV